MKSIVLFLSHDFKPAFRQTLTRFESSLGSDFDAKILFDDSKQVPDDLNLGRIELRKMNRHPSPFDPLGQAHNFYLDFLSENRSLLDSYDYFWILENDVYYHGNIREFFDIHAEYDQDLLAPEIGLRHKGWCWLNGTRGIDISPMGATLVFYRASARLMRFMVDNINSDVVAHMEVAVPHICSKQGFTMQQFVPDHISMINTFRSPLMDFIEQDIKQGTERYIQKKMYHPIKL
jgi:hypothetical protein